MFDFKKVDQNNIDRKRKAEHSVYQRYEPAPKDLRPRYNRQYVNVVEGVEKCMKELNLHERLEMFKKLYNEVPPASQPFIRIYVTKTKNKIKEMQLCNQQYNLPF